MMPPAIESLPRQPYQQKPSWRLAPARPIRTLCEVAGTGLPAFLLSSKPRRRFLGRAGVSPKTAPAHKSLSGQLSGPPVEMLLGKKNKILRTLYTS
jgi:hypothetical protein